MATKTKDTEAKEGDKLAFVSHSGVGFKNKIVTGKDNKLTPKQQALKAKGELDEDGNPKEDNGLTKADKLNLKAGVNAAIDARTPKEEANDVKYEERLKYYEAAGYTPPGDKVVDVKGPLYKGWLTLSGTAGTTGEAISVKYEQAEPTTEEGCFHAFRSYFPSAVRDGFKIDADNEDDPTKRTYLER